MGIDPNPAAQSIIESLLDKQWFTAALILFFFIMFIFLALFVVSKVKKMIEAQQSRMDLMMAANQTRQDERDRYWFERSDRKEAESIARMDKRDDEQKETNHNYYNAQSTTALTLQAIGQSFSNVADRLENIEDHLKIQIPASGAAQ